MIFVTVGTTYAFDRLVEEIDRIAPEIDEKIIVQTGTGKYKPKNCQSFNFKPSLKPYFDKARLVISHGGAGTSFEILSMGKPLISVENPDVNDQHQWDLLKKLESERYVMWCKDPKQLKVLIESSKGFKFRKYVKPKCTIHKEIIQFLDQK